MQSDRNPSPTREISRQRATRPDRSSQSPAVGRNRSLLATVLCAALLWQPLPGQSDLQLALSTTAISPNNDGSQDDVRISLSNPPINLRPVDDWFVEILDGNDEKVRVFRADKRKIRAAPSIGNLYIPDDDDLRPVQLFDGLIWDGRDSTGKVVPDGVYRIQARVRDSAYNYHNSNFANILVDTRAPELNLRVAYSALHIPIGQNPSRQDRLDIVQNADSNPGSYFTAEVLDSTGEVVNKKEWENGLPSRIFIYWDELRQPDALDRLYDIYTYRLTARDPAGNYTEISYPHLIVNSFPPVLDIRADEYHFSPNGDGIQDRLTMRVTGLDGTGNETNVRSILGGVRSWDLTVLAEDQATILYQRNTGGPLPETIAWDGRLADDSVASDGRYFLRLTAFTAGTTVQSPLRPVFIDVAQPDVSLGVSNDEFTPDEDMEADELGIRFNFNDASGIQQWRLAVYLIPDIAENEGAAERFERLSRLYSGQQIVPTAFAWNGVADDGELTESGEKYILAYEVRDRAGNTRRGETDIIETGIMMRPLEAGGSDLVTRLPLQGYFDRNGRLTDNGEDILDDYLNRLRRYGSYQLYIECHSSVPGREEHNLLKSEQRARSVYDYFIENDINPERMLYRGLGESEFLFEGDSDFEHYRNERIQIRLLIQQDAEVQP
ncbi:MAG: OmpA family protein [Leptospiraceae bacterium]|nr:OmpA family protein [Leptospiraceae bacterium]